MPTLTKSLSDFSVKSNIGSNWISSTGEAEKTFALSGIPKGSSISSATLSGTVRSQHFGGTFKAKNPANLSGLLWEK